MDTAADQIVSHIQRTREDLSSNISELENKVKSVTDWKKQFQAHPMLMMGIAFGGGVLLSGVVSASPTRGPWGKETEQEATEHAEYRNSGPSGTSEAWKTWEATKLALIGLAASRLKEVVDEVIPGFKEHFETAQERRLKV